MNIQLRFGMHRDIPLIHLEQDKFDGLVIPAHILAHQPASTSVFVTSMPRKPYVIDPMTFIFQNETDSLRNDSGKLRISIDKLCEIYHKELSPLLQKNSLLEPSQIPDITQLCDNLIQFQLDCVETESGKSAASKYLKRYAESIPTSPRFVLPPYFRFDKPGDDWYQLNKKCAEVTRERCSDTSVSPVICCSTNALDAAGLARLIADYEDWEHIFIWIDNFNEITVSDTEIERVRHLIQGFRDANIEIETLYGGYLMILSHHDGLLSVSHGILYTQHKSYQLPPGSGGVPDRYYIPLIHGFRSLSQTDLILHKHPELICKCPICSEVLSGNPDNIIRFEDNPDLLRRHFLAARRSEATSIAEKSIATEAAALQETFDQYHKSFLELPNPDALVTHARMPGLEYLSQWASAFS